MQKKTGEELKTSFKIYCFKAQDLGIDFKPSAIKDNEFKISEISIYPNPASDYIEYYHAKTWNQAILKYLTSLQDSFSGKSSRM